MSARRAYLSCAGCNWPSVILYRLPVSGFA